MQNKVFKKYRYDIALNEGVGEHLITWMTGLMIFFVCLTLALNFSISSFSNGWSNSLSQALTVEIRPPMHTPENSDIPQIDQETFAQQKQATVEFLQGHPDVASVQLLDDTQTQQLIEPWLGANAPLDIVPLPALIDIAPKDGVDLSMLKQELEEFMPHARLDTHDDMMRDVESLAGTLKLFSFLLTAVITLLSVIAIVGAIRSKFAIHQKEVEILHQIGAQDSYIARQFRRHALSGTLKGALAGTLLALACISGIGYVTGTLDSLFLSQINMDTQQWLMVILCPVVAGIIISHLAAQMTVLHELERLT